MASASERAPRLTKLQRRLKELAALGLSPTRIREAADGALEFDFGPDSSTAAEGRRLQQKMEDGMGKRRA
jgi:hypothetical protein